VVVKVELLEGGKLGSFPIPLDLAPPSAAHPGRRPFVLQAIFAHDKLPRKLHVGRTRHSGVMLATKTYREEAPLLRPLLQGPCPSVCQTYVGARQEVRGDGRGRLRQMLAQQQRLGLLRLA
jgi:hypothetical protein